MEAIEALKTRRSIRKYKADEVPEATLKDLVDCARLAATARNEQPWEFVVVREKKMLSQLAELAPNGRFIKDAAALIAVFCKDSHYYLEDGSAATENILLAAHALGLGAVWLGVHPIAERQDGIRGILSLPDGVICLSLIAVGHPSEPPPPADRYDPARVHQEKW